jgi:hypothetical protein
MYGGWVQTDVWWLGSNEHLVVVGFQGVESDSMHKSVIAHSPPLEQFLHLEPPTHLVLKVCVYCTFFWRRCEAVQPFCDRPGVPVWACHRREERNAVNQTSAEEVAFQIGTSEERGGGTVGDVE